MDSINKARLEKKEIAFDVTNPRKSYAGHTVYRLQLMVYKNAEINPTHEFLGWKRFNDFKRLYKDLKAAFPVIFNQCFPYFVKGKMFGRFDERVIEERRQAALRLLMFTVVYPEMISHQSFEYFVNSGASQITPYLKEAGKNNCETDKQQLNSTAELKNGDQDAVQSESGGPEQQNDILDVLNCNISECIIDDISDDESEVFISTDDDGRESWLLEARSICGDDIENLASEAAEEFPVTPRQSIDENTSVLLSEPLDHTCTSPVCENIPEKIGSSDKEANQSKNITTVDGNQNKTNISEVDLHEKFKVDDKMSKIIDKTVEEDDYVFQASVSMSNAIEQEEIGNIEAAFDMYKFGIGLLLRGVQIDDNADRREAVRRKTAQYLLRAEELYKSSIKSSQQSPADLSNTAGDNKWRFRLSDVKVFGIIDRVMLVQKIFSGDVFVMKVLQKQGGEYKGTSKSSNKKQPRNLYNCHYMVKLMNCVETSTGVYLLLEHIAGGKLWDYLNMPIFYTPNRTLSYSESHHSWDPSEYNTSFADKSSNFDDTDVVDIPLNSYTHQGISEVTAQNKPSLKCKIKRSPSQNHALTEADVRMWAAQIAYGLMDLHSKGVICKDLNPHNILIDSQGNVRLTYFSNVDGIDYSLNPQAKSFLYTSPEVERVFEPTEATDWWSYGAILFELLTGESLHSCHPNGLKPRSVITLPRRVSNEACSLLAGLLKYDARERFGSGPSGNEEIKSHPFFAKIDWEAIK